MKITDKVVDRIMLSLMIGIIALGILAFVIIIQMQMQMTK